jgi:hypothetical protein
MFDSTGYDADPLRSARRVRNDALVRAQEERARATHDADLEFSENAAKLRERFEVDLAEAAGRHRRTVRPAHRAFNKAVKQAEDDYAAAVRALETAAAR